MHLLRLLLGAQPRALEPQLVLFRVRLGVEQALLHVLLGAAHLLELGGGAVGDVEAAAAGAVRVEDGQRGLHVVERHALEMRHLVDFGEQRADTLQPL